MQVKDQLNEVADDWTEEQKAHCLEETSKSFQVQHNASICFKTAATCRWACY